MSQSHARESLLLLPRPRVVEPVAGLSPADGRDGRRVEFPVTLGCWGSSHNVFRATLGDGVVLRERVDACVVVDERQDNVPSSLGYELVVAWVEAPTGGVKPSAVVRSPSDAGVRAGLQTLAQLFKRFGRSLPAIRVRDWPALATRGVMLDVSRCRIPTMEEFGRVIPLLASLKFNHLQLYTEHTFAYADHRDVWAGWDPITPVEMRTLAALGAEHGITLGANQNCFGHMKHWLERPRYAPLAETHAEFDFYGMRRQGPFSLCPTDPTSRALVCGLLDELVPCVQGAGGGPAVVNIGCDETADVGFGRSRDAVASRGKAALYAEHVGAVLRHASSRGWMPQFWGDIALEHPEVLDGLPSDATALAWGYEADSPFERWGRVLAERGRDWWVCPGTSSWRSITGRTMERGANIEAAARAGVTGGASGFMVCDWGDVGHLQQWPVALAALAQAADAAWTGGEAGFDARATSIHALGQSADGPGVALGPWLDELGDVDAALRRAAANPSAVRPALRNASALFSVLWPAREEFGRPGALGDESAWNGVIERIDDVARRMPVIEDRLTEDEMRHTLAWARLAAGVGQAQAGSRPAIDDMGNELATLGRRHAELWAHRSRAGGLRESMSNWEGARRRVEGLWSPRKSENR